MDGRERLARLASVMAAACLVLSGCAGGEHTAKRSPDSPPKSSNAPGNATAPEHAMQTQIFRDEDNSTIRFELLSLARLNSRFLKLRVRMTPVAGDSYFTTDFGGSDGIFSDLTLTDESGMKGYFPLAKQGNNDLAGSDLEITTPNIKSSGGGTTPVYNGQRITATIFYPSPPPSVTKVDIMYPAGPPFTGVNITGGARVEQGEPDPTKIPLKGPHIEDLLSRVDDLSGDKSVDDSGSGRDIRLNTDVLFALNKASLSAKAGGILKYVAQQIDKASNTVIKVDGYTDNSGNDAINNPLSNRRAEAVANKLKGLVTRSGVSFKAAGHGSADPVATNDSAAGRKKNRRVTVTIGK